MDECIKGIYIVLERAKELADRNDEHLLYEEIQQEQSKLDSINDYNINELSENDSEVIYNAIEMIIKGCVITEKKKKHIIGCVCSDIIEELGD